MGNTITQEIGQLSKIIMTNTMDRTICTTSQPPAINTTSKTSCSTITMFFTKTEQGHRNIRTQTLNNALVLVHRK